MTIRHMNYRISGKPRRVVSKRLDKWLSASPNADFVDQLYDLIYRRVSARIASPVLDHIKTGEEVGPFI